MAVRKRGEDKRSTILLKLFLGAMYFLLVILVVYYVMTHLYLLFQLELL